MPSGVGEPSFVGMSYVAACLIEAPGNEQRLAHLSALVHHSSGIPTWQDCNALTIKLVSPSDDDHKYGTLGRLWDHDVASETVANISRRIAPPRWLISKRSPASVSWNEKYSHPLKIQACDYHFYGYHGSYFTRFEVFRGYLKFRFCTPLTPAPINLGRKDVFIQTVRKIAAETSLKITRLLQGYV